MFDDSEQQQISHLFQQIIILTRVPLMWRVMSGPCRQHMEQEEASSEYAPKKCDTRSDSSNGMSWVLYLAAVINQKTNNT